MSQLLSTLLHTPDNPVLNNMPNSNMPSPDSNMLSINITNPVQWCPVCHGKKFASIPSLNKYKDIECPYCAGQGAIKICKCNRPMPLWQEKCYNCILRLDELEKELEDKDDSKDDSA